MNCDEISDIISLPLKLYTLIISYVVNYSDFQKIPEPFRGSRYRFRKQEQGTLMNLQSCTGLTRLVTDISGEIAFIDARHTYIEFLPIL